MAKKRRFKFESLLTEKGPLANMIDVFTLNHTRSNRFGGTCVEGEVEASNRAEALRRAVHCSGKDVYYTLLLEMSGKEAGRYLSRSMRTQFGDKSKEVRERYIVYRR